MNIKIVTDSTWDFDEETRKEHDIEVVPLYLTIKGKRYREGVDISNEEFYEIMKTSEKLPQTSQPTPFDFVDVYKKLLKEFEKIISIHISSKLSGTYNSALIAKNEIDKDNRITVIDSKNASGALGLIVYFASLLKKEGKAFNEIVEGVKKAIDKIVTIFVLDNLKALEMGGRIGKAKYLIGTILNFKPVLSLKNGIIEPYGSGKIMGTNYIIPTLLKFLKENYKGGEFIGGIANNIVNNVYLKKMNILKDEILKYVKLGTFLSLKFGATITSHIGLNSIGFSFLEK
ncbi:MAG: DegV family protein [Caldisericia bacterium]|jgi:DegV family protein with EDD domain|nr:DegV family protein [Caldisericia bacterium]